MNNNRRAHQKRPVGSAARASTRTTRREQEATASSLPTTPEQASSPSRQVDEAKTPGEPQPGPAQRNFSAPGAAKPIPAKPFSAEAAPDHPPSVFVHVKVIRGDLTRVKSPVAVSGRYQRLPLAGQAKEFDALLDSWLSRAVELGMIGSGLGEVFLVPLEQKKKEGITGAENLLLVGMGEPGHFGQDDLRYLMSNVTVAVKCMGHEQFSISLLGSRRGELSVRRALRGLLEGVTDGFERFRSFVEGEPREGKRSHAAADKVLVIMLVEPEEDKVREILKILKRLRTDPIPDLELNFERGDNDLSLHRSHRPPPDDLDPEERTTLVRIARSNRPGVAADSSSDSSPTIVFQFSALAERAAITVREVEVNSYFLRQLPARLTGSRCLQEQEAFGGFLANYLIPEEFRRVVEGGNQLTLVLDEATAGYPWEMAAFPSRRNSSARSTLPFFFGTELRLARQFRTLLSAAPGVAPPLNRTLKTLVIADPAADLPLPGARAEGLAVVEVYRRARQAWKGTFDLKVTVRIGPYSDHQTLAPQLDALAGEAGLIQSAKTCDPLELLMLMVNEQYDVIHYAGHGIFDPEGGRMGWVFDKDCVLSAQEIFRVRQVPRLVFANACLSARTGDHEVQRQQQVGLAQAFFARGIQNYVGTGWEVEDAAAKEFAAQFYQQVLGLQPGRDSDKTIATAPPATLGESLAAARRALLLSGHSSSTWAAYQHYGRANDKLLPLPNRNHGQDNKP